MNDVGSTLVAHCGARKIAREDLKSIPVPEGTKTHQPLSHYEIVEVLQEALSFRHLNVVRDEYAVSTDGMKMFGVMDLNTGFEGGSFSIGLRNSNDKSMRLALTAGYRVFVCDNMAFSGDFTPLFHKHTRNLELKDSITIAVDRIQRSFNALESRVGEMRDFGLTDNDARLFIYRAFLEKAIRGAPRNLMAAVHENYFDPLLQAFRPRNLWSLSNAFTSAFKILAPMKQFEVTARLGAYLSKMQDKLGRSPNFGIGTDKLERLVQIERSKRFEPESIGSAVPGIAPNADVYLGVAHDGLMAHSDNICETTKTEKVATALPETETFSDQQEEEMIEEFGERVKAA